MSKPSESSIVSKCARLMDVLSDAGGPLPYSEIVARTGFAKSSCHRILSVLQAEDMVLYDDLSRRYRAGGRISRWKRGLTHPSDLQSAAVEELKVLNRTLGLNVALSVLDGDTLLYLLTEQDQALRYADRTGDHAPLHCTAGGKLLLAHVPSHRREKLLANLGLEKFTEHTITDPTTLAEVLSGIVDTGYAVSDREEFLRVVGVATPVRDMQGRVVAALSMWGFHAPAGQAQVTEHCADLSKAADRISERLGWTGQTGEWGTHD